MGSCNHKTLTVDKAVSRVSILSDHPTSSIFSKYRENNVSIPLLKQLNPSMPRRSSALNMKIPLDVFSQKSPRRSSELNLEVPSEPPKSNVPRRSSQLGIEVPTESLQRRSSFNAVPTRSSILGAVSKTETDCKLIKTALQKHFIFSSLTELQISSIVKEMNLYIYPNQTIIFEQHSTGDNFFIISKGKVEVVINLKVATILNPGDSFGEVALLHDTPRTATIITLQETALWGLDRETFRGILKDMSSQKYSENMVFLENIKIFKSLTKKQKECLANAMISEYYTPGSRILHEGDEGDFMYIIKEGSVIVTQKGMEIRKLSVNEYFGEQALMKDRRRTATVTALDQVSCLSINSEGLFAALGSHLQDIIHLNTQRMAMDADRTLHQLTAGQINEVISRTTVTRHRRGAVVVRGGVQLEALHLVLDGCISCRSNKLKALCILGVEEIMDNDKAVIDNYVAIEDSDVAEISFKEFEAAIGGRLADVIERNEVLKILREIKIFRGVDIRVLERMTKMLSVVKFRNQNAIVTQNQPGDSFFIIKSGIVEVKKSGVYLRNISKNDYFGERSLIFNKNRSATVRALGDVECWVLTRSQFATIFDENMKAQLLERIELQDDNIEIIDLYIVRLLYSSKVSEFFLGVNKNNSKLYVLKVMTRNKVVHLNLQKSLITQKKILAQVDHALVVHLIRTFKDPKKLCMLMEFVRGADFSTVIHTLKKVDELDSRFYAGCFLLIFEYLHDKDIIYRDFCLKNLMVDLQGYPKLIDFASAKYIQGRTYTLIGTPHYVAPEVVNGQGYGITADYWSLGITLYQIMYGALPFAGGETDPVMIYKTIINHRLVFPNGVDPLSKGKEFVSTLLNKDPVKRGNIEKLKTHPWFVGLNWDMLINKQIKAPFLPIPNDFAHDIRVAIKAQRGAEELLANLKESSEVFIPKFNVNSRWDVEF